MPGHRVSQRSRRSGPVCAGARRSIGQQIAVGATQFRREIMRMATGILVALGLVFPALISSAADEGSRPPGVLARDWVRISERLGFVVTQTDGGSIPGNGAQVLRAAPEMGG